MSNSLDPEQARRIVVPDLCPNCLPRLSADETGRQRVIPDQEFQYSELPFRAYSIQKPMSLSWDRNLILCTFNIFSLKGEKNLFESR